MAAATLTSTAGFNRQPRELVSGANIVPFDLNSGATKFGTLSDVYLITKIPNGALIYNTVVEFGANANAAAHFNWQLLAVEAQGTFSVLSTLGVSMTGSTVAAPFYNNRPTKVSLSDDRAVQHVVLALNCTTGASATVSFSLQGRVEYLTDGSNV